MIRNTWYQTRPAICLPVALGLCLALLGTAILTNRWVNDLLLSSLALIKASPASSDWPRNMQLSAFEILVEGIVIVAVGVLAIPRLDRITYLMERTRLLEFTSVTVLVALWLPVVLIGRSAVIAGERYWWLGDDAMISMRFARNLANGMGLVWNAGEYVEGYTNFLWTAYMAHVHLLPIPISMTSLVVLLTNIILAAATIPAIVALVHALGGRTTATVATVAAYVFSANTMYWGSYGYETVLLTFLFVVALYRVLNESQSNGPTFPTYLLIGSISLVRADAIVLSAILYLISMLLNRDDLRPVLAYSAISFLVPLAHEVYRIQYYGDVLPNTAYLKTINWDGRYIAGLAYVSSFAMRYVFPIALAAIGARASRRWVQRYLLAMIILYMAYIAFIGGDAFPDYRFFVPVFPLLMALAFVAVQDLELSVNKRSLKPALGALCLVTIPLITPGYAVALLPYPADQGNVEIGLLLKQNTPLGSRVADFWAGSVLYFSDRYAIDLLGKSDRHLAREPIASKGMLPGHNKFDFDYSLGVLKPDFVVSHFKLPVTEERMRQESVGNFAYTGQLYFNPLFREHCLPNPIDGDTWRTVFACDWSS